MFKKGPKVQGMTSRGSTISILAFEVANTIVKGVSLLHSLSEENIRVLKKEILHSDGVGQLVSTDMKELLSFVAADKRLFLVTENSLLLLRVVLVYNFNFFSFSPSFTLGQF